MTINYGLFINNVISFIIIALVIFFIIRAINRMRKEKEAPATQECPFCLSTIPLNATRCAFCTSQLATG